MKVTIVLIEDRPEVVEWWEVKDFRGRFNMFCPQDEAGRIIQAEVEIMPIADDCIVCDYCNADLVAFPVPVVGSDALCPGCFRKLVS